MLIFSFLVALAATHLQILPACSGRFLSSNRLSSRVARAYILSNLLRNRAPVRINNNNNPPMRTRICPASINNSFYIFCDRPICYAPATRNACCMFSYYGNDGTHYMQCRCEPSVTCGADSGADSSDDSGGDSGGDSGQTTQTRSLCSQVTTRVLNSQPVTGNDACAFGGIANVTVDNGQSMTCNAVLTRANVAGTNKLTFLTASSCTTMVDVLLQDPNSGVSLQVGHESFPLGTPFTTVQGPDGSAFIDLPEANMNLLDGLTNCESPACGFDEGTMSRQVDTQNCKMVSYGTSDPNALTFNGKREVDLRLDAGGCADVPDLFGAADTLCFQTQSAENAFCLGDNSAPVYCRATSTSEWVLMGVTAFQAICNGTPNIKVIRFPE